MSEQGVLFDLVVLGGGPGGYTTAFRAADLGLRVAVVEQFPELGGTCLHVGCIPSKTLLHTVELKHEVAGYLGKGLKGDAPDIDVDALRTRKEDVVSKLARGLMNLARQRKVKIFQGRGRFKTGKSIVVSNNDEAILVAFEKAVIASGSRVMQLPGLPQDSRIIDSTGALALTQVPERLAIIGGGIIGLEMATVYHGLGCEVSIVEMQPELLPMIDRDIYRPLERKLKRVCKKIFTGTRLTSVRALQNTLELTLQAGDKEIDIQSDVLMIAAGRVPNSDDMGLQEIGVEVDSSGFILVNSESRATVPNIFAIGDVTGQPMLAHRAVHQGRQVAEIICGKREHMKVGVIPSVVYTDPEIAWVGESEQSLKESGKDYLTGVFPWAANGRSLSQGRNDGITKLVADAKTGVILGGQITGPHAGELISEISLAIEAGLHFEVLAHTVHPHPTLCESLGMAAEDIAGEATDLPPKWGK